MSLKNTEERIYDLLSQKLSGDADAASLRELDELIKKHPQFLFLHDQLIQLNNPADDQNTSLTDQAFAAHYVKMIYANEERMQETPHYSALPLQRKPGIKKYLVSALSIAAVLAIAFFYLKPEVKQSTKGESSIVATDTRSKVMLPDGTTVVLNAGSKIDYGKDFNEKERKVLLTGEAYFDVAHNPRKPFIVHTQAADVKVHGTQFNVKNYDNETWETTLLTGKVEVLVNNAAKEKFILKPSQKLAIQKADAGKPVKALKQTDEKIVVSQYTKVESHVAETSWIDDRMIFVDRPLYEIAAELERQFHITVSFQSEKTKMYRYTGVFSNESLTEVLQILAISRTITYRIENNHLLID